MLSLLDELTLQKRITKFREKIQCFRQTKIKPQQQQNTKSLPEPVFESGSSCIHGGCVTSGPTSQLKG